MDSKRVILAAVISIVFLLLWDRVVMRKYIPAIPPLETQAVEQTVREPNEATAQQAGAPEETAERELVTIETPLVTATFSNRGGAMVSYVLKATEANMTEMPVSMLEDDKGHNGAFLIDVLGRTDLSKAAFKVVPTQEKNQIHYTYERAGEFKLTKKYTIRDNEPAVYLTLEWENLSVEGAKIQAEVTSRIDIHAADGQDAHYTRSYALRGEKLLWKGPGIFSKAPFKKGIYEDGPLQWAGFGERYVTSLFVNETGPLDNFYWKQNDDDHLIMTARLPALQLGGHQVKSQELFLYYGPKSVKVLREYGADFEKIFWIGKLGFLRVGFLWMLNFFYGFLKNYGLAILALTVLIRVLMSPLMHFSYDSMRKMQAVQPQLQKMRDKYQDDPQKLNAETMEIFRKNKVNPFGGCLPMLLQFPIFIAFWQMLYESIELKGAPFFGWITDLAAPDQIATLPFSLPWFGDVVSVLPVLTTATMLVQQMLTPTTTASKSQKPMMIGMSILFGILFYKLPSGVLLYWCASNVITIVHQMIMFRDKLHLTPHQS